MDLRNNFTWSDDLSTTIELLDDEHRQLIQRYRVLMVVSKSKEPLSRFLEETERLSEELRAHFLSEESVMRHLRYPHYREHKTAHHRLIEDISDFIQSIKVGLSDKDLPAVAAYFRHSFVSHIKEHDVKLACVQDTCKR